MLDALYTANVLAERACPVCGTDRHARRRAKAALCGSCGVPLVASEGFVRVAGLGARAACSIACLRALIRVAPPETIGCPWCEARWPSLGLPARSCATCAEPLRADVGYVGFVRAGRIRAFCDPACLSAHLARSSPYCG